MLTPQITAQPKPEVVVFVKADCPCTKASASELNRLADALQGKAHFVGMIDADRLHAKAAQREFGLHFSVAPDPQSARIHQLGGISGLDMALLDSHGHVVKNIDGFGREQVRELLVSLGKMGVRTKLNLATISAKRRVGCMFVVADAKP